MQAIETEYRGPTNTRGSRIIARAQAGWVSVPYDHALDFDENHDAAAKALVRKLGWIGSWVGAQAPNGRFVYIDRSCTGFTVRRSRKIAVNDTVKIGLASRPGVVKSIDNRRKVAIVDWGNGVHGPEPLTRLTRVAP